MHSSSHRSCTAAPTPQSHTDHQTPKSGTKPNLPLSDVGALPRPRKDPPPPRAALRYYAARLGATCFVVTVEYCHASSERAAPKPLFHRWKCTGVGVVVSSISSCVLSCCHLHMAASRDMALHTCSDPRSVRSENNHVPANQRMFILNTPPLA
jgi:hypothetical protein